MFRWNLSTDPHEIKNEIISTRLMLVLFLLSLMILSLYSYLPLVSDIIIDESPSFQEYNQLLIEHHSLQCSCSNTSISYGKFIRIDAKYHQICQSSLLDEKWIAYFSEVSFWVTHYYSKEHHPYKSNLAFHTIAGKFLVIFSTLCQYINETISNDINILYNSRYISTQMINEKLFYSEINNTIDQFINNTINSFINVIKLIETTTRTNGLQTFDTTDSYVMFISGQLEGISIYQTYAHNNCSCQYKTKHCYQQAQFYRYYKQNQSIDYLFSSDNFYAGCYIMESLTYSTLHFFYNQTILDKLPEILSVKGLPLFYPNDMKHLLALNQSLNNPNETIQQIFNRMLVERWNRQIIYEDYFNQCKPDQCIYTINQRRPPMYIITTFFGFIRGIITIFKIIILLFIKLIRNKLKPWIKQKLNNTIQPIQT